MTSALAQTPDSARIELPDQRTYWSKTYYNAQDNTYKTIVSAGYIHYQAADGSFKDIDTLPDCVKRPCVRLLEIVILG